MKNIPKIPLGDELLQAIGAIPSSYLGYYYKRDAHVRACQAAERCRGEECQEIEANLLAQYGDTDLAQKPDSLAKRGGALYSTAAVNLINSLHNDLRDRQVVNTRNQGALPFLADDDVVEVQCVIGKDQVKPVPVVRPINLHIAGLIQAVKAYEKLTVEAALSGDRAMALAALLTHPLIGDFDRASTALNEMLEANRAYLPRFFESLP